MRYLIILVLVIICLYNVNGQELRGTYISSHSRDIRYETRLFSIDENGSGMVKLDTPRVDTFYSEELIILDFINESDVAIKFIGWDEEKGNYKLKNNRIKIKSENLQSRGIYYNNDSLILIDNYKKKSVKETYFYPISKSTLLCSEIPDSHYFYNSNWRIEADTTSINFGFDLHFLDSNFVIISQQAFGYGYTNWGELVIDEYKNHLFIGILNRGTLEHKVYHVKEINDSIIEVDNFEHWMFADSPPDNQELRLVKVPFPNEVNYNSISGEISGKWKAVEDVIPFDRMFRYDTLINQSFTIEFKQDSKFTIIREGTLLKDDIEYPQMDTVYGKWKLGKSLKYIVLHPDNDASEYITIKKLEGNSAEFYMDIEAFKDNFIQGGLVKMIKITGHNNVYSA